MLERQVKTYPRAPPVTLGGHLALSRRRESLLDGLVDSCQTQSDQSTINENLGAIFKLPESRSVRRVCRPAFIDITVLPPHLPYYYDCMFSYLYCYCYYF